MNILYVALGGAFGSVMRYLLISTGKQALGSAFPFGTLLVNVGGSFLMGIVMGWLLKQEAGAYDHIRLLVAVGALGGFTTFSAFSYDVVRLLDAHQPASALIYALGSVVLSVAALMVGLMAVRQIA